MNGAQLAQAVAELAREKPEYDTAVKGALTKWVADTFFKSPSLASLSQVAYGAGGTLLIGYVTSLKLTDAAKLAKKLDPFVGKDILPDADAVSAHLSDLLLGKRSLTEKPAAKKRVKVSALPFNEILKLHDGEERRRDFDKMKPADLKKAIKEKKLDHLMLPAKASKVEMVEHIESALAAGWPQLRGILHPSQG